MELWACGFNAWNQLQFEDDLSDEPKDLFTFKRVLTSKGSIRIVGTSFSACLAAVSDDPLGSPEKIKVAGSPDGFLQAQLEQINESRPSQNISTNATVAGNDKIASFTPKTLTQYPSLPTYLSKTTPDFALPLPNITQLVSNTTTFTALTHSGTVYTWGDERYPSRLGRETSSSTPAHNPSPLSSLTSLPTGPIHKLSSSGPLTAALTTGHDLYIWGTTTIPSIIPELSQFPPSDNYDPIPLDIHGADILDFGIGENHMLVLTTEGEVYVIGENGNGQLGLGEDEKGRCEEWRRVDLEFGEGAKKKCVGVWAGYKCSFVAVVDSSS
ncbi:hypothetical protein EYC80_011096 [Monilinia laxa]|uniref:Regulator of chromosome condensation 1/beta-lactamase-inhibitor protein II n=1 Tax=Monilinia laxa TaxID=61186 RepID=A0A5N6JNY6_MONLA|nr:hypothetical protein EYC80_011096 [Monilinia laxa]